MKAILCLAFIGLVAAATLPANEQRFVNDVHAKCQANRGTYADENLLKNLGDNVNNVQVGIHMLCMSKGAKLQKPNGVIDNGEVKNKIALVIKDHSKVNQLVSKCAVDKGAPEKTAVYLWLCLNQNGVPYTPEL